MKCKRLVSIVCCLLTVNLLLAPIAHAAVASPGQAGGTMMHAGENCELGLLELVDQLQITEITPTGDQGSECEHGATCNFLCSVATSALNQPTDFSTGFDRSNRWLSPDPALFESRYRSRLDRPPRL